MRKLAVLALLLPTVLFAIQPDDVDTAIALGSRYKTEMKCMADIAPQNAVCKKQFCYLFFSDFEIIAGAAARANQEMRHFSRADVRSLPLSGFTSVYVIMGQNEIGGIIGAISQHYFARHWARGNVHMALKFGDQIIQPVSKSLNEASIATTTLPIYTFWKASPNSSLLFGGPLQVSDLLADFEFTYNLTPEQQTSICEAILIDCQGKKYIHKIDLSQVLHVKPHIPKNPSLFEFGIRKALESGNLQPPSSR